MEMRSAPCAASSPMPTARSTWLGSSECELHAEPPDTPKPRMSKRRRFIVVGRWALAAAWAAVVYFGPAVSAPSAVAYFVEFAVLGFLLANALWQHMGLLTACAAAVLITCMLGIADGAVSLMVPDHPFSFFDWLVGAGGALAGGIVAHPALRLIDSFVSSDL